MNTQKKETTAIMEALANAFYEIGENGLAFAMRNFDPNKAEQLAEILMQAGFTPKE